VGFDEAAARDVRTPEGVTLPFELASVADRITAFGVDFALIHAGAFVLLLLLGFLAGRGAFHNYALSAGILGSFLLRNFYFSYCEIRYGGRTPGKRAIGLRVISREGGPLSAEAVLARNLTRDLEVFLPLTALALPEALIPGLPGWATLTAVVWLFVFALLPLLNRDRLRLGDLVGGTLVVRMPAALLLADLTESGAGPAPGGAVEMDEREKLTFASAQLDQYGIEELQVLESVLRRAGDPGSRKLMEEVARRVMKRIDWPRDGPEVDAHEFLSAFYRAQRARLEHKMLFGVRQERKK
jgi:uncharacterized RDD family membrane protein YckC